MKPRAASPLRDPSLRMLMAPVRRELAIVVVLSLIVNLLMLVPTVYMLQVYDRVLTSHNELTLVAVSFIALALVGVMALADWIRSRHLVRAGQRIDASLGPRVYDANLAAYRAGSPLASTRAPADFLQVRQFLTGPGIFAILDAPWAPLYIAVAWALHPFLGGVAIVFVVLQLLLAWLARRAAIPAGHAAGAAAEFASNFLQSKLRNAEVVAALGMGGNLRARWKDRHVRSVELASQAQSVTEHFAAAGKFLRYCQQSLGLAAGALLVIRGDLSPGAMIAANLLIARALAPIEQLAAVWRGFGSAREAFDRLAALLAGFPRRPVLPVGEVVGDVSLESVTAYAPGSGRVLLDNLTLDLRRGALTVVIGHTGAGKSTLGRLLMGVWPRFDGELLLDGQPMDKLDRTELGPRLGYLPQEVQLLEGTVAQNICRFGELDSEGVIEAARTAGLHDVILRLPQGYDTRVGPGEQPLSAGQRQRIGLARAIYGNPALVVLDEPNAHLDEAGEQALHEALRTVVARGTTALVITHRPGVVALADDLLVLLDGRIEAHGPRAEVQAALPGLLAHRARRSSMPAGTGRLHPA